MPLSRDPAPTQPTPTYRVVIDGDSISIARMVDMGTRFSLYTAQTADQEFATLLAQAAAEAEGGTFDPSNEPF